MTGGRLTAGHAIGGRFVVTRLIGSGPMGEVVEVRDQGSGLAYACKILLPGVAESPAWALFADEARRATSLGAGVARVLETGFEAQASSAFVLSELMTAPSLASKVAAGVLAPHDAASLVRGLVVALGAAHSAGIAHRDLVPTNVFVDDAGAVRLTDFAIAALRGAVPPPSGAFALGWVPPEQVQGAPPAPTMDVYGVGLLAFFALTGRSPFLAVARGAPDAQVLWTEMTAPLPPLSARARELGAATPPSLDAWFSRALAVDAATRFTSVREMAEAMDTALGPAAAAKKALHGTMVMGGPTAAQVVAQASLQRQQLGNAPTQTQQPYTPAPAPAPGEIAGLAPAAAPFTYGGDEVAGVPTKKSNTMILAGIGVGAAALLLGGLLAFFLTRGKDAPAGDTASASASATASAPPSASAPPPPVAASASAAPDSGAPDSLVTVKCDPECDQVKCDGKKIDPSAGVRLAPGKHSCVASKKGFVPTTERFTTKAGEDAPRSVTLTKLPEGKPAAGGTKKCKGTFISNCN